MGFPYFLDTSSPEPTDDLAVRMVSEHRSVRGRIYGVGYEGLDLPTLIDRLLQAEVAVLVDVRLHAVSRRPGFSRRALEAALTGAGIEYVHERELGNPKDNRDSFRRGDGVAGRERMRVLLSEVAGSVIDRLVERARSSTVAVLCVERDPTRCHRSVITDVVQEIDPEIEVSALP